MSEGPPEIPARAPWWQDPRGRTQALLVGFAVLALIGVLLPGIFNYLLAGDRRQLVVSLQQGVTAEDRERLKATCGTLPGVEVVADRGRPEAQFRFPVRFRISDATQAEEIELDRCIDSFGPVVRGVRHERDR